MLKSIYLKTNLISFFALPYTRAFSSLRCVSENSYKNKKNRNPSKINVKLYTEKEKENFPYLLLLLYRICRKGN